MSKDTRYEKHSHVIKKTLIEKDMDIKISKLHEDGSITLKGIKFNIKQSKVVASTVRGAFILGAAIVGAIWWICA